MEVLHGLEWQCKPMKLTCLQQQGRGPAVSWKVLASSEVFRFTFWKVVLASNAFIWPFAECRFVVMIPNFKHNGIKKLILLINLIFVLQVLQNCPVNSVTHTKILCEYIYILWIYMYIYIGVVFQIYRVELHNKESMQRMIRQSMNCNSSAKAWNWSQRWWGKI